MILFITVIAITVLISTQVVNGKEAYGQTVSDRPNIIRDWLQNGILLSDGQVHPLVETPTLTGLMAQIDEINVILDYCYEHADNANPVQELVDKGLIDTRYNGSNCANVKRAYDMIPELAKKTLKIEGLDLEIIK